MKKKEKVMIAERNLLSFPKAGKNFRVVRVNKCGEINLWDFLEKLFNRYFNFVSDREVI